MKYIINTNRPRRILKPARSCFICSKLILLYFVLINIIPVAAQEEDNGCDKTTDKKAVNLYKDAEKKFKAKVYGEATYDLKKAIEINDSYYEAYYILGRINYEKLNLFFANKYFLKVIELCPDYRMKIYFYLGNIAFGDEKYEDAIKYLSKYLKNPEKIEAEKEYTEEDYNEARKMLKYAKTVNELMSHPVPFNPKILEGISTKEDEYLFTLSPDNEIAYFTRNVQLPPEKTAWGSDNKKYREMFMYSILEEGKFDKGQPMPPPFNIHENEGGATVTLDNKTLYYTVCEYLQVKKYQNCDIYRSGYKNDKWGAIEALDSNINSPDSWESQPSISSDGKTLYFVSDRAGGFGGYDIYVSHKDENGKWSPAENLGKVINSKGNEKAPFIHPDNRTLYFSSDGRDGLGGYDIYYSRMNDDGTWSEPKNIGYPINTRFDDVGFYVSTDGHKGYFASNKMTPGNQSAGSSQNTGGGWDIFDFDLYKEARPGNVLLIKGVVKDEKKEEPVKAKIELQNIATRKLTEIPVDSATGEYALIVPFSNDYLLTVKKEGYAFSSKYFSSEDTTLTEPQKLDIAIKPVEVGETYRLNDIHFATDSFTLTDASKIIIDKFIDFLNENPHMKIAIHGHTDNLGKPQHNLLLSENRAKSVYEYMISKGINKSRLNYEGYGDSKPLETNDTEEGRAVNRRTEFVITEK